MQSLQMFQIFLHVKIQRLVSRIVSRQVVEIPL